MYTTHGFYIQELTKTGIMSHTGPNDWGHEDLRRTLNSRTLTTDGRARNLIVLHGNKN